MEIGGTSERCTWNVFRKEKYFWSATDGVLTAHVEWLLITSLRGLKQEYLGTEYSDLL